MHHVEQYTYRAPYCLQQNHMKYFAFLDLACIKVDAAVLQGGLSFFTLLPC